MMAGWRSIGRSLVVVVVGSDELRVRIGEEPDVVVIHFNELPSNAHELRAFSPEVVDVAIIDTTAVPHDRARKLSEALRQRLLASVLMLPNDHYGEAMFRRRLGVVMDEGSPWVRYLWMTISVAVQETWALGWMTAQQRRVAPWTATREMLRLLEEARW